MDNQKRYATATLNRATQAIGDFIKSAREPNRANEILGSREHQQLFEKADAAEVEQIVLQKIRQSEDFANDILTYPVSEYTSETMREAAEEKTQGRAKAEILAREHVSDIKPVDIGQGRYVGRIIGETEHHVIQEVGRGTAVIHDKTRIGLIPMIEAGSKMVFQYFKGRARAEKRQRHHYIEIGR